MGCVICKAPVTDEDWDEIKDEWSELFMQADALGVESLTEHEQVLLERAVHLDCYDYLS